MVHLLFDRTALPLHVLGADCRDARCGGVPPALHGRGTAGAAGQE